MRNSYIHATASHHRGSAYVLILMTTMIVTVIGLSAIALSRIELRRNNSASDAAAASAAAHAAVEWGLLKIRLETTWANLGSGTATWASNIPFAGGSYSLSRTAFDNTDPINPRLTLLAVGRRRDAVYQLQVVIVRGAWVETSGWTRVIN